MTYLVMIFLPLRARARNAAKPPALPPGPARVPAWTLFLPNPCPVRAPGPGN